MLPKRRQKRRARMVCGVKALLCMVLWCGIWTHGFDLPYRFYQISIEEGLSQSVVTAILRDSEGYMWFGTQDGLNQYDGYRFKVHRHDPDDPESLAGNYIWSLYEDNQNRIWVGTEEGGFNLYDRQTGKWKRIPLNLAEDELAGLKLISLFQCMDGFIWVGTNGKGLWRFNPEKQVFRVFRNDTHNPRSLRHNYISAIVDGDDGTIWLGSNGGGLFSFASLDGTLESYTHQPGDPTSLSDNRVNALYQKGMNIYVGTEKGLCVFDLETRTFSPIPLGESHGSISHNSVKSLLIDSDGNLWIGTDGAGMDKLDTKTGKVRHFEHFANDIYSISSNRITSVYEDKSGLLWVGTVGGGINKVTGLKNKIDFFRHIPGNPNSLPANSVRAISAKTKNEIWIGLSAGGLSHYHRRRNKFTNYGHDPDDSKSLSDNRVRAILESGDQHVWVGTDGGGLNLLQKDTGTFQRFMHDEEDPHSIGHNRVAALIESDGQLYVGTNGGGLYSYNGQNQQFSRIGGKDAFGASRIPLLIRALYSDREGRIWIGTDGLGLAFYDPSDGRIFATQSRRDRAHSISHNKVWSFYHDNRNQLWIGTSGGLNLLNLDQPLNPEMKFKILTVADGLANNIVYGILPDKNGFLWLSTNNGLSRFDPLDATFSNYDSNNGLQSDEFNQGAFFARENGELFFGGIQGLNVFYPDEMFVNRYIPNVILTGFRLMNQPATLDAPISQLSQLDLSHKDSIFTIEFSATDYRDPERNRFRYQLEGFHDWVEVVGRREVTFTNLDSGNYRFKLQAGNNDGVWNEEIRELSITIIPPWWKTDLAYIAYVLMFLGALYLFYQRQQQKIDKERADAEILEREVQVRTHKLRETQQKLVDAAHLAGMAEIATEVLHNIGNALNSVNVSAFVIEKRVAYYLGSSIRLMNRLKLTPPERLKTANILSGVQKLAHLMEGGQKTLMEDISKLHDQVNHIRNILTAQQSFAAVGGHYEWVDLTAVIHEALEVESTSLQESGVLVETNFAELPKTKVLKAKLVQVLCHLIKNACEAMSPSEGERRLILRLEPDGEDYIAIFVQDTGSGIPPEQLANIFAHGFTTKKSGHGFGLHFCANAVTEMKGRITVESDGNNRGATFRLVLPVAEEPAKKEELTPVG